MNFTPTGQPPLQFNRCEPSPQSLSVILRQSFWLVTFRDFPGRIRKDPHSKSCAKNLREVIAMLLEDGEPELEAEFVGTEAIQV